jgi:hypothetical protein
VQQTQGMFHRKSSGNSSFLSDRFDLSVKNTAATLPNVRVHQPVFLWINFSALTTSVPVMF